MDRLLATRARSSGSGSLSPQYSLSPPFLRAVERASGRTRQRPRGAVHAAVGNSRMPSSLLLHDAGTGFWCPHQYCLYRQLARTHGVASRRRPALAPRLRHCSRSSQCLNGSVDQRQDAGIARQHRRMTVRYADDRLAKIAGREANRIQHGTVCCTLVTLGNDAGASVESHLILPSFIPAITGRMSAHLHV